MNNATNNEAIILSEINVMGKIERQGNWKREWLLRTVIIRITKVLLYAKSVHDVSRFIETYFTIVQPKVWNVFEDVHLIVQYYENSIYNPSEASFVVKKYFLKFKCFVVL